MKSKAILCVTVALLLTSCPTPAQTPAAATSPWSLSDALAYAAEHSPDARIAQQRIQAAQAGFEQANAGVWPRLQFQSAYGITDNPMLAFGNILNQRAFQRSLDFNNVPDVDNWNTRGQITVPLYTGGRTGAERRSAQASLSAARLDSDAVRNTLAFEVVRGFETVIKTRAFVRAVEATVHAYETNLDIARKRFAAGSLLKTDVLDLEVRLAQTGEDLVRARNARELATRTLQTLLGLETQGPFEIVETVPPLTAPAETPTVPRPEIAAAAAREQAAGEQVRVARSGFLPRVSAFGGLDYDYGFKYDSGGGSYTVGAMLQWDIWDGFLTRSKVREARASENVAREEARKTRLAASLEVDQARLNLEAATQRLEVSGKAVEQATESAQLTRLRFGQGLALVSQTMDAESALVAARVRRAEAEADQQIAVAALRKALGLSQLDPR